MNLLHRLRDWWCDLIGMAMRKGYEAGKKSL